MNLCAGPGMPGPFAINSGVCVCIHIHTYVRTYVDAHRETFWSGSKHALLVITKCS